jgi:hypothetical protein
MVKTLQELTRPNIWRLKPYSSARDEYNGAAASVFLDANENPYNMPHNRYPDPMQRELKTELSKIKKVSPDSIFLGNGSDEAIDLVFRAFCEPRVDNVVAIDPTYGMYQVCADVNDVEYRKVLLDEDFQFSADKLLAAADEHTKLIFICSPRNNTVSATARSSRREAPVAQTARICLMSDAKSKPPNIKTGIRTNKDKKFIMFNFIIYDPISTPLIKQAIKCPPGKQKHIAGFVPTVIRG